MPIIERPLSQRSEIAYNGRRLLRRIEVIHSRAGWRVSGGSSRNVLGARRRRRLCWGRRGSKLNFVANRLAEIRAFPPGKVLLVSVAVLDRHAQVISVDYNVEFCRLAGGWTI